MLNVFLTVGKSRIRLPPYINLHELDLRTYDHDFFTSICIHNNCTTVKGIQLIELLPKPQLTHLVDFPPGISFDGSTY